MKVIFDKRQLDHAPSRYFRRGAYADHPEQPARAELLRRVLLEEGFEILDPSDHGDSPIKAVHSADFVDFWRDAYTRWIAAAGDAEPIPTYHPSRRYCVAPASIYGQLGWYTTDSSVPLTPGLWDAAYWSAQCAIEAASLVATGVHAAYALCRPPGHHAVRDSASGFCVFNNASVAAEALLSTYDRVAVLDIDTHAGNGTIDIFYERGDVFVCSVHTDPADYPPYYIGHSRQTGAQAGYGATHCECIQPGADNAQVMTHVDTAIDAVLNYKPMALVLSLGFDMAEDDPLSVLKVNQEGFMQMAQKIAALKLPTVIVQEGGYLGPSLASNARAFLSTFRDAVRN